jgi:MFS family permease
MLPLAVLLGITGIATGLALGSMATYTYDIIPEHARARLQTLRRLIGDVGALLGPLMGGLIADVAALAITFLAKESLHYVRSRSHEVATPG